MKKLINIYDRKTLEEKLNQENFARIPVSFYKYIAIKNPKEMRDKVYEKLEELSVLGRIYVARQGINAQICVPEHHIQELRKAVDSFPEFAGVDFKIGLECHSSFIKLTVKVRPKIVADGLDENEIDYTDVGRHLSPQDFNEAMESPDTIVVDMRNHFESRIGRFEGALTPEADTFADEITMVENMLKGKEDKKILLYCTGGIRCEPTSAYLKQKGFTDVNQLKGGIINYGQEAKAGKIESRFKGKNFVFDERLAEAVTDDILTNCDQCGNPADRQTNCANEMCHLLFVQCEKCAEKFNGSCSDRCQQIAILPEEERKKLRKGNNHPTARRNYSDRVRPLLKDLQGAS